MANGVQYVCYIDDTGFYLGDAEHIASFLDAPLEEVTPTWVPAQADGTLALVRSPTVQTLWRALGVLAERFRQVNKGAPMDQTIHLFMPCGHMTRYVAFDDLPWESERCPCGDQGHWLIYYTGEASPHP
jgi:hypothetical protein